jgi:DNA-binding transcriptional ArsR family regulator
MAWFDDFAASADGPRGVAAGEMPARSPLDGIVLRVVVTPLPTLLAIADAVGGRSGGVSVEWLRIASGALDRRDRQALEPVVARPGGVVPDCLLALPSVGVRAPEQDFERIAATDPETLRGQLAACGLERDAPWAAVAHDGTRWLRRYAHALRKLWAATETRWTAGSQLLDRELERVGVAVARGTALQALRPLEVADGLTAQRHLILMPKLTRPCSATIRAYDGPTLTHLAYPVPGARRLLDDHLPPPSSLEALLGPARTRILRQLDRPRPVGRLAEALYAAPSVATHHANALETAGLIERQRHGRHVLVRRTARGTALLALYERG